jgi:hypothetical protein
MFYHHQMFSPPWIRGTTRDDLKQKKDNRSRSNRIKK